LAQPMSSGVELLVPSGKLSDLIARSQMNIQRSQALVAAADALVRVAHRSRRPRFAGGTDGSEPRLRVDPRVLRTWTKVKTGALHAVAAALPADFPVPILIVQHMDPRHKSLLAGLLGRRCRLRVKQAANDEEMRGGTIYIAQPDMHLIVRAGRLVLTDTKQVHFSRPSIDLLL